MEIRIMSWNMAGAKLFDQLDPEPGPAAGSYTDAFRKVWEKNIAPWLAIPDDDEPDIILLQECIGFKDCSASPSGRWQGGDAILGKIFSGYECFFFPAITSHSNPHPRKWNRYAKVGVAANAIPAHVDIQQGYGICLRKGVSIRKLWVPWPNPGEVPVDADRAGPDYTSCFESISITAGLYQGNRDTEPRMVVMGRVKLESGGKSRYLNYLNIHLNTLSGEREGNLRLNRNAGTSRQRQLELILDSVVSSYQEATRYRIPEGREQEERDIWVMGGDFNTVPGSAEIALIRRSGFVDSIEDKRIEDSEPISSLHGRIGSKWSLGDTGAAPIVTDYIFFGLEQFTFPAGDLDISGSKRPFRPCFNDVKFATDHAVLFAKVRL